MGAWLHFEGARVDRLAHPSGAVTLAAVTPPPVFLVNPRAGGGRTGARWARAEARVLQRFPGAEVRFTDGPWHAVELARAAAAAGARRIVAVGGDGTVHEVANGLLGAVPVGDAGGDGSPGPSDGPSDPAMVRAGPGAVLGFLPMGTGSDFARGLGVPDDLEGQLDLLATATPRRVDVGRVEYADDHGRRGARWFVNEADFGLGASVAARVARRRRPPGRGTYRRAALAALLTWRDPEVVLRVDDAPPERHAVKSVFVCNGPLAGAGMWIAPDADPADARLDLVVFGPLGRFEAMRRLHETYGGRPIRHRHVHYRRCARLHAEVADPGRTVLVEADGEPLGRLPATFAVAPARLAVLAP